MPDRLVVDLAPGRVSVSAWLDGDELPDSGPFFELAVPLDGNVLEELRWYLEDYLVLPSGAYGERGQRVRQRLEEWGGDLFRAVFGSGPARDAYVRVCRSLSGTKLVFRSSSPRLLALPWELMRDPAHPAPLALKLAGVSRGLPSGQLTGTVPVPGGKLRVLMVIARPGGDADVGYQMIARPLLERLDAVRGKVDLVVLRPPTLDALERTLSEASAQHAPFHLVHFDGHGKLNERWFPSSGLGDWYHGEPGEGVLIFEKPGGGADPVPASAVARVLSDAKVPVVVLNACQSGAIGRDLEAAIATRLMQEGTASVVAMSYSVYAVAAAEFMAAFYERLFAGDPVSAAVTSGRKRMAARNQRPSRRGDMPLEDWLVPVHYLRRDVSFPQAVTPRTGPLSLDEQLDQIRSEPFSGESRRAEIDPLGAADKFIGRDWLTCQLEVAARLQRVVVLHGPGGSGKTELAKGFGRWWRDTGGIDDPRYVFFRSSEPGIAAFGLDAVVSQIGRALFGTDFDRCEPAERRAVVENAVTERRMLLIWDNFETMHSMPDPRGVTRPLDEDGRRELRDFLGMLAARGKSVVLITSRSPEPWLGDVRRIPVGGLSPAEADQYATDLLEPYSNAQAHRHKPVFGDLMEWLDGHPLSMRLVLPHLATTDPAALLGALRGTAPLPGAAEDDSDRMTSLPASIAYSYAHLSGQARRLLPMVCVVQPVAQAGLLAAVSNRADIRIPERFRSTEEVWCNVLREAAGVGLLTPLVDPSTVDTYQLHPVLPAYLAAQWRQEDPARYDADRESVSRAAAKVYAPFCAWLLSQINGGNTQMAFGFIDIQYRTFTGVLDDALARGLLVEAAYIVILLHQYWRSRGLTAEEHAWADRARLAAAEARTESLEDPATVVWLELSIYVIHRAVNRLRLDDAYRLAEQVRGWLEARPRSDLRQQYLARVYDELGRIARSRGNAEAENWNRMARAAGPAVTDDPASTAGQRGQVRAASSRGGQLDAAAAELHQGDEAMGRGQLDEAEEHYRRSLAISTELRDKPGQASACCQLGTAALKRGLHTEAESWYRDALALYEELRDKPETSQIYVLLGVIAKSRRRLDEAGNWYRQALSILEELGEPLGIARTRVALIDLALTQDEKREALGQAISCAKLCRNPHPDAENIARALAAWIRRIGIRAFEEAWWRETGEPVPRVVRDWYMQWGEADG